MCANVLIEIKKTVENYRLNYIDINHEIERKRDDLLTSNNAIQNSER